MDRQTTFIYIFMDVMAREGIVQPTVLQANMPVFLGTLAQLGVCSEGEIRSFARYPDSNPDWFVAIDHVIACAVADGHLGSPLDDDHYPLRTDLTLVAKERGCLNMLRFAQVKSAARATATTQL